MSVESSGTCPVKRTESFRDGDDMVNHRDISRLHEKLLKRRGEVFRLRQESEENWQTLQKPQVEYEETAANEKRAQSYESLEDLEKDEIEAIDIALRKMEEGTYGVCESCERVISLRRLDAIPWTPLCFRCARQEDRKRTFPAESTEETASEGYPPEYQGMSDEELQHAVLEELRNDGRVELEELSISSKEGTLVLEGALPSETKHQILLEILEDIMEFSEIVDRMRIDPLLWEREDRMPLKRDEKKTALEELLQGEDDDEEDGTPVQPADAFIPEKVE
jgi:DnaK suppressor protein